MTNQKTATSKRPKKHPMDNSVLSAFQVLRAKGDTKAAECITKYLEDMTGLIQTDPEYIRKALIDMVNYCEEEIAKCKQDGRACVIEGTDSPHCICKGGAVCKSAMCINYVWAKNDLAGAKSALEKLDDLIKECAT